MSKQEIIEKTIETLNKLPETKVAEVSDFADFMLRKSEDADLLQGIAEISSQSKSYEFLANEEDLYTIKDINITRKKYSTE